MSNGGLCPPGFYCPNGTQIEIPCPNGTFSDIVGLATPARCGDCPPGRECEEGNPTPRECRLGHYCPGSNVIIPCPITTYRNETLGDDESDCTPCPPGSLCDSLAVVDPWDHPCPADAGGFCPQSATEPIPCAAGSYRDLPYAGSQSDCFDCPPGAYCGVGTVVPLACPNGTYCPGADEIPLVCTPTGYCPTQRTVTPLDCPAGFYCPNGTVTPIPCPDGTYCPSATDRFFVCPAGTVQRAETSALTRTSFELACQTCPPGSYSDGSSGTECLPCPPGFVCLGNTSTSIPLDIARDSGYQCLPGTYCPEGSSAPRYCPVGTYNPLAGRSSSESCLSCKPDSYNPERGASACRPCSASSSAPTNGSTTCNCVGLYRFFQPSDGMCVCQPGYEFVDEELVVRSEEDGEEDC